VVDRRTSADDPDGRLQLNVRYFPELQQFLADQYGLGMGLLLSGVLRMIGFGLFLRQPRMQPALLSAFPVQPAPVDGGK